MDSTHNGLEGINLTIAESPVLMNFGASSKTLLDLSELAGNVRGVAIENRGVLVLDLTRVVENDNLSNERSSFLRWVVLGVTANVSTLDFLDGDTLDVETNVVSRNTH